MIIFKKCLKTLSTAQLTQNLTVAFWLIACCVSFGLELACHGTVYTPKSGIQLGVGEGDVFEFF